MMDRRLFLKLTGLAVAASALPAPLAAAAAEPALERSPTWHTQDVKPSFRPTVTDSTRLSVREPGTYQIYGQVRLQDSLVEINGISHPQQITWAGADGPEQPLTSFTAYEYFDRPGVTRAIEIRGGRLEAVSLVPVDLE
jgi:hypothetical protein